LPGSPLREAGLDLGGFGVVPGAEDFWGTTLPQGVAYDIGAREGGTCVVPAVIGGTLRLVRSGGNVGFTWGDRFDATGYDVYQDLLKTGGFTTAAGSAASGAPGLSIAMPPEALLFY